MSEAEMIEVGDPLPTIGEVERGAGPLTVVVTWAGGARADRRDIIDLAPVLMTYKVFIPLRDDPALFASLRVAEFGEAIEWGEDDELAVSATTLQRLAEETMTNADFAAFLKRHGLTRDAAAGQLGIARHLVSYYAHNRAIPRHIMLACRYLDAGMRRAADRGSGAV